MKIIITGGAGFVGARLAKELLQRGTLNLRGQAAERITHIVLADRVAARTDLTNDPRISCEVGDLFDQLQSGSENLLARHADAAAIFHMAAAVSGECEANFDLGMRSNYATTHALLESCRALKTQPTVFFASSIAVFGTTAHHAFPHEIVDTTLPTPQTSYGIQKLIGEQLMADYARKGFIRARTARLATVSVRAGQPNGAASGFFSGMIREPLNGIRCTIPVKLDVVHSLSSPAKTVEHIIACMEANDEAWGPLTALNLPAVPTTVGEMADTLRRVAGDPVHALLDWKIDPAVERIVSGWPTRMGSPRAQALGMKPNASFEEIVRSHIAENHPDFKV
ncbi:D-erythronate dehydrogenase [Variovorax sp. PCZ-1]|uniref:D-erythronate dehydrogenase n=1 Tax=Variovorax sp. PCZ-1 TaxID=2835533 RepID=UPI001BCFC67B|nr:D-erythronate dehydrogenase [Variovorax sp. PCZ-1]MBS7807027.1 NAD-dependent epimerase/dehydratase family protein [Variovorax sp. PCZ-1]